jgi:signal transduction histidine kinase
VNTAEPVTPSLAALRQARARRLAAQRWVRPLWLLLAAFLLAGGLRSHPRPALSGTGLAVTLALTLATAGLLGLTGTGVLNLPLLMGPAGGLGTGRREPVATVSLGLLIVGSGILVWIQPDGNALLGLLAAMVTLTRLRPARLGAAAAGVVMVFVGAAELLHSTGRGALLSLLALGGVFLAAVATRRFREDDSRIEALLMELERSRNAEVRAATLAERQRLAREMHDVLAHSLSGLTVQLQGARLLATTSPADPRLPDTIDQAHRLARSGLQEARRAIGLLRDERPVSLDGPDGLVTLASAFERDSGVPCRFSVDGELPDLDPEARLALYRVTQEALTNVRKHARPSLVEIRLDGRPEGARLVIEDCRLAPRALTTGNDRKGAATRGAGPAGGPGGYGLTGMRERAELLGGSLTAAPTADGFVVTLWLPA